MRIFIYKFLIMIVGVFFLYQLTIGYTLSKLQKEIYSVDIKQNSEIFKKKIKKEIVNSLKKDKILNKEDAVLIKKFFNKIYREINATD